MDAWAFFDLLADTIPPALFLLILEEPLITSGTRRDRTLHSLRFWLRALLAIGVTVLLAELGKKQHLWPGHPNFPSGHTTFATAAATSLVLQRGRRWAGMMVTLALLEAFSLIYDKWHTPEEALGGLILGAALPPLVWRLMARRGDGTRGGSIT